MCARLCRTDWFLTQSFPHTKLIIPRGEQVDGESYHFVTVPAMEAAIRNGEFIEYAPVHGNYYGTSKKSVADVCEQGKVCILDIDIQGVKSVHEAWTSEPVRIAATRHAFVCRPPSVSNLVGGWFYSGHSSCSSSPLRKKHSRRVYAVAGQR